MKDRALQEALRQQSEQRPMRLSSNFAYNTMRRIEKEQQAREWQERVVVTITIVVSFLLGVGVMVFFYGEALLRGVRSMIQQQEGISLLPGMTFCLLFFATLNYFLHRHYVRE